MPPTENTPGLEQELAQALGALESALQSAADSVASIRAMAPRLAASGSVLQEIETLVRTGRQQDAPTAPAAERAFARPTLVVPSSKPHAVPVLKTLAATARAAALPAAPPAPERQQPPVQEERARFAAPGSEPGTTSFRLEFESSPGPLNLRAVDDAVSDHPSVRDVALLDYDGRRATLKVWIAAGASPASVQEALKARSGELFPSGHTVSIVALEDAA
jgi:hypothetical protein